MLISFMLCIALVAGATIPKEQTDVDFDKDIQEVVEKFALEGGLENEEDLNDEDAAIQEDPLLFSKLKCFGKCFAYRVCRVGAKRIKISFLRNLALKKCSLLRKGCSC